MIFSKAWCNFQKAPWCSMNLSTCRPPANVQYRVVCMTVYGSDVRQITKLLLGLHGDFYDYAIIPINPENLLPFTWGTDS